MLFVWKGISMYEYCVLLSLQRTCGVLFTVYNVGQISTTRRQICWRFGVTVKIGKSLIDTLIKEVDKKSTWLWTGRPWRAVFIFLFLEITLQSLFKCQGIFNWLTRFFEKKFFISFCSQSSIKNSENLNAKAWLSVRVGLLQTFWKSYGVDSNGNFKHAT